MHKQNETFGELLKNLNEREPAAALCPEQNKRISSLALEKIKAQQAGQGKEERPPLTIIKAQKPTGKKTFLRRALRAGLAAAIVCASSLTVFAVGSQLVKMLGESIEFFRQAPSRQEVEDPAHAPRADYEGGRQTMEAFNARINQSAACSGITVTLESISMDVSSMDVFFTITGKEAMQRVMGDRGTRPLWGEFYDTGSGFLYPCINGRQTAGLSGRDWYVDENGNLKLWQRFLLGELPKGPVITVELAEYSRILETPGNWVFRVELDGESVRSGGKTVEPGIYGDEKTPEGSLDLQYLAFGPKGGTMKIGNDDSFDCLEHHFKITDDTGKEIYASCHAGPARNRYDLSMPAPDAKELTFTPVQLCKTKNGGWKTEQRTISLEELENGAKIETNSCGGYIVKNFTIKGSSIFYELVPYGWNLVYGKSLSGQSGERPLLWLDHAEQQVPQALDTFTVVPQTGVISVRIDFYDVSEEELKQLTQWNYEFLYTELLPENALVLDLQTVGKS